MLAHSHSHDNWCGEERQTVFSNRSSVNLELGLKSRALRKQVLRGVVSIVDVHICMVAANTLGEILGTLPSLLAALIGHAHVDSMENLVAKLLRGIGQFIGESSESFNVGNDFLITVFDSLDNEPAHAVHNSSRGA